MIEAEGHIFVTRPIVKAKETAGVGEGNHCMLNTHTELQEDHTQSHTCTNTHINRPS